MNEFAVMLIIVLNIICGVFTISYIWEKDLIF